MAALQGRVYGIISGWSFSCTQTCPPQNPSQNLEEFPNLEPVKSGSNGLKAQKQALPFLLTETQNGILWLLSKSHWGNQLLKATQASFIIFSFFKICFFKDFMNLDFMSCATNYPQIWPASIKYINYISWPFLSSMEINVAVSASSQAFGTIQELTISRTI